MPLSFGPSLQKLKFPNITLNGFTKLTTCCWARVNTTSEDYTIFACGRFLSEEPLLMWRDERHASTSIYNTFSFFVTLNGVEKRVWGPKGTWNDTKWHHLATSFDTTKASGRAVRCYFDGVLVGTNSNTIILNSSISSTSTLSIGNAKDDRLDRQLNGAVEDFRIYERELSAQEILTIYNTNGQDFITQDLILRSTYSSGIPGDVVTMPKDLSPENQTIDIIGSPTYTNGFSISDKRRAKVS